MKLAAIILITMLSATVAYAAPPAKAPEEKPTDINEKMSVVLTRQEIANLQTFLQQAPAALGCLAEKNISQGATAASAALLGTLGTATPVAKPSS